METITIVPVPNEYMLHNIYPSPFNAETVIRYNIPEDSFIELSIYNLKGQLVETLLNNPVEQGYHTTLWDANNVSSGVYFIRMKSPTYQNVIKCMLVK